MKDIAGKLALIGELAVLTLKNPAEGLRQLRKGKLRAVYRALKNLSTSDAHEALSYGRRTLLGLSPGEQVKQISPKKLKKKLDFPFVDSPSISIIIPVHNNYELTLGCLNYVLEHTQDVNYEIIVADDCSSDKTIQIEQIVSGIKVVRQTNNLGFTKNCNAAAKAASGKFLLFLNNDTQVQPGWLEPLWETAERDPRIGLVGPKLLFPDGLLQEAGGIIWNDASGWNFGRSDDANLPQYNYVKDCDYISGACLLINKETWEFVKGFDEIYSPAYYEDTDLAFRLRDEGYRVVYQPASRVVHLEGKSHGVDIDAGIKRHQKINQTVFREKWKSQLAATQYPSGTHVFKARDRSRDKKTMLIIDHYVPEHDKDAGSRSTLMYLEFLVKAGLNVKFLSDNFFRSEPYTTLLEQLGIEVLVGQWYAKNWKTWLTNNCEHIDYAYLHRPHITVNYIDFINRLPYRPKIIYFGHDLHYLRATRQYELDKSTEAKQDITRWKTIEFDIFRKADVVYYPSEQEVVHILADDNSINVKAIPLNIYPLVDRNFPSHEDRSDLIFVGGFNHPPNLDAFNWFHDEIFPKILQHIPALKIYVVGSRMPKSLTELEHENIIVVGRASDDELNALYERVRLSIVPLRYGAGVKGKVLESMRIGVPVVTTPIGAEGIPAEEEALSVAQDADEFCEKVVSLYGDTNAWHAQQKAGLSTIKNFFSEKAVFDALREDIELELNNAF